MRIILIGQECNSFRSGVSTTTVNNCWPHLNFSPWEYIINHDIDQIITNKVVDGLETRKREVSARMFSDKIEEPEIEEPKVEVQAEPEPETTETQ